MWHWASPLISIAGELNEMAPAQAQLVQHEIMAGIPIPCDNCNKPIVGPRIRCINCPSYDVCLECSNNAERREEVWHTHTHTNTCTHTHIHTHTYTYTYTHSSLCVRVLPYCGSLVGRCLPSFVVTSLQVISIAVVFILHRHLYRHISSDTQLLRLLQASHLTHSIWPTTFHALTLLLSLPLLYALILLPRLQTEEAHTARTTFAQSYLRLRTISMQERILWW